MELHRPFCIHVLSPDNLSLIGLLNRRPVNQGGAANASRKHHVFITFIDGVVRTTSGYAGGDLKNPTYEQVSAGVTGHAEAVKVEFDPQRVSYRELVDHFWRTIDPTVKDQQFRDHGHQYRSAIFYLDETQRQAAEGNSVSRRGLTGCRAGRR